MDRTLSTHGPQTPGHAGHAGDPSPGNRWAAAWQQAPADGRQREALFEQIFRTYYRCVYAFFAKRGLATEECKELAQDTFLKVHRGLPSFRCEARFETWLFQITANVFCNTLRSRSTQKREAVEVALAVGTEAEPSTASPLPGWTAPGDPLDEVLREEKAQQLRKALDELPTQMRRCVLLRVDQDLRYREIAVLLQVSIETVKAHLYQARQQLKAKLGAYFAESDFSDG